MSIEIRAAYKLTNPDIKSIAIVFSERDDAKVYVYAISAEMLDTVMLLWQQSGNVKVVVPTSSGKLQIATVVAGHPATAGNDFDLDSGIDYKYVVCPVYPMDYEKLLKVEQDLVDGYRQSAQMRKAEQLLAGVKIALKGEVQPSLEAKMSPADDAQFNTVAK